MREKEFSQIKSLLGAGIKRGDLTKALKRSYAVIALIDKAPNFASYKQTMHDTYCKKKEQKQVKWTEETPSLSNDTLILEKLNKVIMLLQEVIALMKPKSANPFYRFFTGTTSKGDTVTRVTG